MVYILHVLYKHTAVYSNYYVWTYYFSEKASLSKNKIVVKFWNPKTRTPVVGHIYKMRSLLFCNLKKRSQFALANNSCPSYGIP